MKCFVQRFCGRRRIDRNLRQPCDYRELLLDAGETFGGDCIARSNEPLRLFG
jgi:hypothetical protein